MCLWMKKSINYITWVFKKWGNWSGRRSWILALIPRVTCEESPKGNFILFLSSWNCMDSSVSNYWFAWIRSYLGHLMDLVQFCGFFALYELTKKNTKVLYKLTIIPIKECCIEILESSLLQSCQLNLNFNVVLFWKPNRWNGIANILDFELTKISETIWWYF